MRHARLTSVVVAVVAACNGPIDAGGSGVDAGVGDDPLVIDDVPAAGSLEEIQQTIIAERCSGQPGLCHNGQFEPNLSTTANTYAYLVNRPSIEKPDLLRVNPGDPDTSVVIDKLRGRDVATRMPLGADPLSEDEIQQIEAWIAGGALRRAGADPAPVLNNPPRAPEIGVYDSGGARLDVGGSFTADVGETLTFRHSVHDFETPDDQVAVALMVLSTADGRNVILDPGAPPGERDAVATAYSADGVMGIGDELNYRFDFTIPATLDVVDGMGVEGQLPASGAQLTPIVFYLDLLPPDGILAFTVATASIQVN